MRCSARGADDSSKIIFFKFSERSLIFTVSQLLNAHLCSTTCVLSADGLIFTRAQSFNTISSVYCIAFSPIVNEILVESTEPETS
jgi:hypothetical protein